MKRGATWKTEVVSEERVRNNLFPGFIWRPRKPPLQLGGSLDGLVMKVLRKQVGFTIERTRQGDLLTQSNKWNTNIMDLRFLIEKVGKMSHKHTMEPYPASPPSPNSPKNGLFGEGEDSRE
jgi:hypothetical protein